MSKFKIGDRVRLLSDAWLCARKDAGPDPRFGRAGEVGTVSAIDDDGDFRVDGVGNGGEGGWFCEEQLEHADPQPPVAHHDRVVSDPHAAIDRLVAHLERQATEHVHALDALRAEVEALRAQNAHLRALQAATEAKPVREVVRGKYGVFFHDAMWQKGCSIEAEDGRCAVNWNKQPNTWMPYDKKSHALHGGLTEPEAIAWVLDGMLPAR